MKFRKMHGLGNDFVILDHRGGEAVPPQDLVRKICDRHFGVGCDQLIVMESSDSADVFMRIFNGDGTQAQSCGNATRCVASVLMEETGSDAVSVKTAAGRLACKRAKGGLISVDMGIPAFPERGFDETIGGLKAPVLVDMGNPHAVYFVENAEDIAIETVGPQIENHPFFPQRTNVEFVSALGPGKLRQRTWERGAGLTLACGSGACAVTAAAVRKGLAGPQEIEIVLDGGSLFMQWPGEGQDVRMTGPSAHVFDGVWKEL